MGPKKPWTPKKQPKTPEEEGHPKKPWSKETSKKVWAQKAASPPKDASLKSWSSKIQTKAPDDASIKPSTPKAQSKENSPQKEAFRNSKDTSPSKEVSKKPIVQPKASSPPKVNEINSSLKKDSRLEIEEDMKAKGMKKKMIAYCMDFVIILLCSLDLMFSLKNR